MKSAVILILIGLLAGIAHDQAPDRTGANIGLTQMEPRLFESIPHPNCEYLQALLDAYSREVPAKTDSFGTLVLKPGPDPIKNRFYERYLRFYIASRKLDTNRFAAVTSEPQAELRIELWISPKSRPVDIKAASLSNYLKPVPEPIYFEGELFERFRQNRSTRFAGLACEACCISSLDWNVLTEFLNANPTLTAYVIVRGQKSTIPILKKYLMSEIKKASVSSTKIRLLSGGPNRVNDDQEFSEVVVYLSRVRDASVNQFPSEFP